jgi:hypothetical protein
MRMNIRVNRLIIYVFIYPVLDLPNIFYYQYTITNIFYYQYTITNSLLSIRYNKHILFTGTVTIIIDDETGARFGDFGKSNTGYMKT